MSWSLLSASTQSCVFLPSLDLNLVESLILRRYSKLLQPPEQVLHFMQRCFSGCCCVLVKAKTHAGLDLTGKNAILEHLAEWCERICKEHGIDPGSEALQALRQQQQWYEELKHDNTETHGMLEEQDSRCDRLFEEPMPQWGRCLHDCALCRRACPYGKQKAMVSS